MLASQIKAIYGIIALALCLPVLVSAQQYIGSPISNQTGLPSVLGANITWFNILDPASKNATLTNYLSFNSSGNYMSPSAMKRVIIIIHGLDRDPSTYMSNMLVAISNLLNKVSTIDNTQIVAPYFPNGDDKNVGYPWTDGLASGKGSTSAALVWQASGWASGENAQYPWNRYNVSSYAVLDQIIGYYGNKTIFPNVNQIVVAGHSLGAQTAQRYAAVGKLPTTSVSVSYWVANPNSLLWFTADRPLDYSTCPTYNDWRDGFANYSVNVTYQAAFAATPSKSLARYNSRQINYARGLQDLGDDSSTCAPFSQGGNRNERFFSFIKAFPPTSAHTIDYAACGHDFGCMASSAGGQQRLFYDNFNGNGTMATDFYCPRQQVGDDPNPSPSCGVTAATIDAGTYNGYTYKGCYTDQSPATLSYSAFSGWSNASASICTAVCKAAGYPVAGLEYGNQCFCGNGLAAAVRGPLVEAACGMACPGNSSQICGDANRLSIFSTQSNVTVYQAPSEPSTVSISVGTYNYLGCYTDIASVRALSGASTSGSAVSVESCVAYCANNGYVMAGMEYADECYCGNSLNNQSTLALTTDCNMPCAGNSLEYCGGSYRMNVYKTNATIAAATTTAGSSTATISTVGSTSTATTLSCPASGGRSYSASNGDVFNIQCFVDHAGGDLSNVQTYSLDACLNVCATTSGCVAVSFLPGSPGTCYMHSILQVGNSNLAVWGAVLNTTSIQNNSTITSTSSAVVSPTSKSTSASIMSTTTISNVTTTSTSVGVTSLPSSTSLSCPASNGVLFHNTPSNSTYRVDCSIDYTGGDLTSITTATLDACIQACDSTPQCIAGAYVGTACYLKSVLNAGVANSAVWGFVRNGTVVTTTIRPTSTATATSFSSTATATSSASITPISATSTSTTSSSTAAATLSCPSSNGITFTTHSGNAFQVQCFIDHAGADLSEQTASSLDSCLTICSTTSGCVSVSWIPGAPGSCYMHSVITAGVSNNGVWGAVLLSNAGGNTSTSSLSSSVPAVTSTASTSLVSSMSIRSNTTSLASSTGSSATLASSSITSLSSTVTPTSFVVSVTSSALSTSSFVATSISATTLTNSSSLLKSSSTSSATSTTSSVTSTITSASAVSSSATPTTSSSTSSATVSLPSGFSAVGCYADGATRTWSYQAYRNNSNTPALCAKACAAAGYQFSGTEYSTQCFCGNSLTVATSSACTMSCAGDSTQICGGSYGLSVVKNTINATSAFVARPSYASWTLDACFIDSVSTRTLPNGVSLSATGGSSNATVANCLNACATAGYAYCGLEYYAECYGSNTAPASSLLATPPNNPLGAGCNYTCNGNSSEACGGSNRVLVYYTNGTSSSPKQKRGLSGRHFRFSH